ncbi:DUF6622 family protein [Undibacterium sp. SXout20W]
MLQAILTNTPIWVWFILLFLLSRGIKATQDRTVSLKTVIILPIVMLLWSLQGIFQHFGLQINAALSWGIGCVSCLGTLLYFRNKNAVTLTPEGLVHLAGSWKPFFILLGMFSMKYVENVLIVMNPAFRTDTNFIIGTCLLFGAMNGVFLGNLVSVFILMNRKNSESTAQTA